MKRYRTPTTEETARFWSKVERRGQDECWPWLAGKCRLVEYGAFYFDGSNTPASRFSKFLETGENPDEMLACHTCDNPVCVNPSHIFWGTHDDNKQDCVRKGRNSCGIGEGHGLAKLTWVKVREIRARYSSGGCTHRSLAKDYGVSFSAIRRVVTFTDWKEQPIEVTYQ